MSPIAASGFANPSGRATPIHPLPRLPADTAALTSAHQVLAKAQGRVDADRAAHSPDCVAFDQKGLDAAANAVAQAQSAAQNRAPTQPRLGDTLSVIA